MYMRGSRLLGQQLENKRNFRVDSCIKDIFNTRKLNHKLIRKITNMKY